MIEIRTLGRTSVAVRGAPVTGEAAWPKSLALIVYMAREPGPDRRDEILGVLDLSTYILSTLYPKMRLRFVHPQCAGFVTFVREHDIR